MPLPLIPVVAGAIALTGAVTAAGVVMREARLAKKLAAGRVAILGRPGVGKTALLHAMQKPSKPNMLPATADALGGHFELEINGQMVTFSVPRDLPGDAGLGYTKWKHAFDQSGNVWYLFRADLVASDDHDELTAIKRDIDELASWMSTGHHPRVLLIGTWADAAPDWTYHSRAVAGRVSHSDAIKAGLVKMHHAKLVIGSLRTIDAAERLRRDIRRSH